MQCARPCSRTFEEEKKHAQKLGNYQRVFCGMWVVMWALAHAFPLEPRVLDDAARLTPMPRSDLAGAVANFWSSDTSGKGVTHQKHEPWHMPDKVVGMYLLVSDNKDHRYTDSHNWTPQLRPYQVDGFNVLFLTFVDPASMVVPLAMRNLAATRGMDAEGSLPEHTTLIVSVGGQMYSKLPNTWTWLSTPERARAMAAEVAKWQSEYRVDGIDIDLEWGSGNDGATTANVVVFIAELGALCPSFIITQPVYGYPQVQAESAVVNAAWPLGSPSVRSNSSIDRIAIMVYEGTASLEYARTFAPLPHPAAPRRRVCLYAPMRPCRYVNNYAQGSRPSVKQINVNVPPQAIMVGISGGARPGTIATMASAIVSQDLGGMFVWYGSLVDKATGKMALSYDIKVDAATWPEADDGRWAKALKNIRAGKPTTVPLAHSPSPPPPLPPDTTCYDIPPPSTVKSSRQSCDRVLQFGQCNEDWMIKNALCNETCGRCHVAGGVSVPVV